MSAALSAPTYQQDPTQVAPRTFVIHEAQHALGQPLSVFFNSVLIEGTEPILIDTGSRRNRAAWHEDLLSLIDPKRMRWVFISHEDADHVGNLDEVIEACPNATLVCSWALIERHTNAFDFPLGRCRWMDDGLKFDAGDREMTVLRPPIYDSPTTRGLFDGETGVYWAADCFATPVPGGEGTEQLASDVAELDDEFWTNGMTMFAFNALAPWLALVDQTRFDAELERLSNLKISSIISAHSPAITGSKIGEVLHKTRLLPSSQRPPTPDQAALDMFLAATDGP